MSTRPSISERLLERLREEGIGLPPGASVRRRYGGPAQRNLGAWSWHVVDDRDVPQWRTAEGQWRAIGSQWPMKELLACKEWTTGTDQFGDLSIDPSPEDIRRMNR